MGQVTPLFKKNEELRKENYRPVTVLPALNNVLEKLLASQLDQLYSEIFTIQYPVPLFSLCTKSLIAVLKDAKQLSEENGGGPFC